jgi:F420-dependent oxidoreductase-like protein
VRVSISLTNYSWPGGRIATRMREVARAADDAGIDTVWVPDHLLQANPTVGPGDLDMLEAYTTLGFLAAATERVRLGTAVTAVTFREPALLVKAVGTVDALSGGRAWLGMGAGYLESEASAMGLPLPPVVERFERLEEAVQIAARIWDGDTTPFEGVHYRLGRPQGHPAPLRRPPLLIGGTGERRTLRLVAQYADACNVFDIPDGGVTVRRNLEVLARHCADVGRDYDEIEKTLGTRLFEGESGEEFARRAEVAASWGIEHVVVVIAAPWTPERLLPLAEAIPAVADVRPPDARIAG